MGMFSGDDGSESMSFAMERRIAKKFIKALHIKNPKDEYGIYDMERELDRMINEHATNNPSQKMPPA